MHRHWLHRLGSWRLAAQALTVFAPEFCFSRLMRTPNHFASRCIISFDCDFPRDVNVLPKLVDLLDDYGCRASFACIGQWVKKYASEHRHLVAAGHEIINHTETHPNLYHPNYDYACSEDLSRAYFNRISKDERRREIERGHATIVDVLGVFPNGFRTPHFGALHVDDVYSILADLDYTFSTSVPVAGVGSLPFRTAEGIWEIPVSPCPKHPFGVFDSWHSIGKCKASHAGCGELTDLFGQLLDNTADSGVANIYLDPYDAVESGELEKMLKLLNERAIVSISYADLCEGLDGADPIAQEVGAL